MSLIKSFAQIIYSWKFNSIVRKLEQFCAKNRYYIIDVQKSKDVFIVMFADHFIKVVKTGRKIDFSESMLGFYFRRYTVPMDRQIFVWFKEAMSNLEDLNLSDFTNVFKQMCCSYGATITEERYGWTFSIGGLITSVKRLTMIGITISHPGWIEIASDHKSTLRLVKQILEDFE
jgi:hypothetical protein